MTIRFLDFELDPAAYVLERAGRPVPMRPKAFDLLVHLIRHRSRVVRREELIAVVWGSTRVSGGSLSGLVNEVRQALGEEAGSASSIRTVHARGYQFVGAIEGDDSGAGPFDRAAGPVLERVAERGAAGVLVSAPRVGPDAGDRLVEAADERGFETVTIPVPDTGASSPGWLSQQLIAAMTRSRGERCVAETLPLAARAWLLERGERAVAGGWQPARGEPPGGLRAIAAMLARLARRQPLMLLIEDASDLGPALAAELARLVSLCGSAPLLVAVRTRAVGGGESGERVLEVDGGFGRLELDQVLDRSRDAARVADAIRLPAALESALLAHLEGDGERLAEVVARLARRLEIGAGRPHTSRSVRSDLRESSTRRA